MQRECWALLELGTCQEGIRWLPSPLRVGEQQQKGPRREEHGASSPAKQEARWQRKSALTTSCGRRESYSSHPAAAHPSQMPLPAALRPHTAAKSHCGLWQLSLLVIIPWEQTCFLFQGRPGERARKRRGRHSATLEAKLLFHMMTWAFIPKPADTNSKT